MYPWLMIWAPNLYFPWSGSVAQKIDPSTNWFFDGINASAGNGRIEKKAFDVASYGRQLGLMAEVLVELADRQEGPLSPDGAQALGRLKGIQARITAIKEEDGVSAAQDVLNRLAHLRHSNPAALSKVTPQLRALLGDDNLGGAD